VGNFKEPFVLLEAFQILWIKLPSCPHMRKGIREIAFFFYGFAQTEMRGGVVWFHPNGLGVFIYRGVEITLPLEGKPQVVPRPGKLRPQSDRLPVLLLDEMHFGVQQFHLFHPAGCRVCFKELPYLIESRRIEAVLDESEDEPVVLLRFVHLYRRRRYRYTVLGVHPARERQGEQRKE